MQPTQVRFLKLDLHLSQGQVPRIKSTVSSCMVQQRDCDVPVAYQAMMVSVISKRIHLLLFV